MATEWSKRLRGARDLYPVMDVYAGPGWTSSVRALDAASKVARNARLAVLSAGLGVVQLDEVIPAYSATFARGPDDVAEKIDDAESACQAHRSWWSQLSSGRATGRSPLTKVVSGSDIVVGCFGLSYLDAAGEDFQHLACDLGPSRLFLICVGADSASLPIEVASCLLPLDACVESRIGGPRSAINPGVLEWLLTGVVLRRGWNRESIDRSARGLVSRCRAMRRGTRKVRKMSDAGIVEWLKEQLAEDPELSRTALLARLREFGSCEQSRFAALVEGMRDDLGLPR